MSKVSFEDIGAVIATFAAQDSVKPGQVVKIAANGQVGACSAKDAFAGQAQSVRGGFAGAVRSISELEIVSVLFPEMLKVSTSLRPLSPSSYT